MWKAQSLRRWHRIIWFSLHQICFHCHNFVTLTKTPDTDWAGCDPFHSQFLKEYLEEGKPVVNEEEAFYCKQESSNEVSADDDDVVKRIKELLENYVKPAVEMDGGAIQFKSYNEWCGEPDVTGKLQWLSFFHDHPKSWN